MTVTIETSFNFERPVNMRTSGATVQYPVIMDKSRLTSSTEHLNHMNGISYDPENPLTQLEMMLYSSFLGQPTFYNPATDKDAQFETTYRPPLTFRLNYKTIFYSLNTAQNHDNDFFMRQRTKHLTTILRKP